MTNEDVIKDAQFLISSLEARESKWIRSFNRYSNNNRRSEVLHDPYGSPLSYVFSSYDSDLGISPVLNICKSCVDTHISKLMQTKVRPFFNAVNGGFKTRKIVRNLQQFFDQMFTEQSIYSEAIEVAKDADIFEVGHLWIDDESGEIKRVRPWEYYFDRSEYQAKKMSRCMLRFRNYPVSAIKAKAKKVEGLDVESRTAKCEYIIYYDFISKTKFELVSGKVVHKTSIHFDTVPVATMYYSPPVKGGYSTSMIDDIYSLQTEIDQTANTIHEAMTLNPANTIFIPEGSEIKPSMLSNKVGNIIEFNAAGGLSSPVTVSTPPPISPAYLEYLKYLEEKAYNITGLSQLSAQSKKPSGLSSGVALQTLEDVESERNEIPLQNYMKLLMDATKIYIKVMKDETMVLPKREGVASITFGQVKEESGKLSIQYSPASALSKDPQTKMQQIEKMISMGMIQPDMAASMMEIPDLEKVYATETANLDVCERIIERAVEFQTFDFYETVNIDQLINLCSYYINRYDANDESPDVIQRLVDLVNTARIVKDDIVAAVTPPPPPPMPPAPPPPPMPVEVVNQPMPMDQGMPMPPPAPVQ